MGNVEKNTYVKRQLTAALLELLEERELREISVSAIAGAAGVHRVSFYRNYREKEDILREHTRRLFETWSAWYGQQPEQSNDALCASLFAHLNAHLDFYSLLNRRGLLYLIRDILRELCGPKPEYPNPGAYGAAFVCGGLYGWIEEWFARGTRESAEEMAALLRRREL